MGPARVAVESRGVREASRDDHLEPLGLFEAIDAPLEFGFGKGQRGHHRARRIEHVDDVVCARVASALLVNVTGSGACAASAAGGGVGRWVDGPCLGQDCGRSRRSRC